LNKILITGASGQLGKSLKNHLSSKFKSYFFSRAELDINDLETLSERLQSINPDIIINCAAMTNVDHCEIDSEKAFNINAYAISHFKNNFNGTFIQLSTDFVFDGVNGPYQENDLPNPINNYGLSKLKGEEIVKNLFEKHCIIRTNTLFSNSSDASFLSWVVDSLNQNKKINVVNDQISNPISVDDLSIAINEFIDSKRYGVFHLGSDTLCSRFEFANMIASYYNLNENLIFPISSEKLYKTNSNYIAKRPLKSGLKTIHNFLPKISLGNSIINSKKD
tara:strand:+ start:30440 stop:31273 length:834 start_codon:yes stop_codon:yes gene_type:complete